MLETYWIQCDDVSLLKRLMKYFLYKNFNLPYCKLSNAYPEMIQYFNMINIERKTEYIIVKETN